MERKKPLAAVTSLWEKNSVSRYPETLCVPMEDGHIVKYKLDIDQPHPCFLNAMELLKSLPNGLGYQYKGGEKRKAPHSVTAEHGT